MKHKKLIILDLDNTIISAISFPMYYKAMDKKKYRDMLGKLKKHDLADSYDKKTKEYSGYVIFERPGLPLFLDFLFKNFKVAVWSAGNKEYVDFIIDHVIYKDKSRKKLQFKLYDVDCDKSHEKYGDIKNLKYVYKKYSSKGFDKKNTFLIDDLPETKEANGDNVHKIKAFHALSKKSYKDDGLYNMIEKLTQFYL